MDAERTWQVRVFLAECDQSLCALYKHQGSFKDRTQNIGMDKPLILLYFNMHNIADMVDLSTWNDQCTSQITWYTIMGKISVMSGLTINSRRVGLQSICLQKWFSKSRLEKKSTYINTTGIQWLTYSRATFWVSKYTLIDDIRIYKIMLLNATNWLLLCQPKLFVRYMQFGQSLHITCQWLWTYFAFPGISMSTWA